MPYRCQMARPSRPWLPIDPDTEPRSEEGTFARPIDFLFGVVRVAASDAQARVSRPSQLSLAAKHGTVYDAQSSGKTRRRQVFSCSLMFRIEVDGPRTEVPKRRTE